MKEVLTKQFWRDVKKTFDDARAETPRHDRDASPPSDPPSPAAKPTTGRTPQPDE